MKTAGEMGSMENDREKNKAASEEPTSAYRDAIYSQAPAEGRSYGYNIAQCYARASEQEPRVPEKKRRRHSGAGWIAVAVVLVAGVLVVGLLGPGSVFLTNRASAVSETPPSREIFEEFAAFGESEEDPADSLALTLAADDGLRELSAEDIYDIACGSTVGVTIPGYATNIFGQTGAYTVTGTGIVLNEDGYILTNYHVIDASYEKGAAIRVITYDGSEYEAQVVGVETDSDLAVLKVEAEGLVPAEMGDSDDLRVGQSIYTVGNPLGELTYTMTSGIVSALDRNITTDEHVTVNMFQIDAAVNNGNSGGPVYNVYGQVIGVVTAKFSLGGMEGLGFAIPVNDVCRIASDLVEKGYVSGKAYLGLTTATVSPSVAKYYDMVQGVYIYAIEEGSCSEAAGLVAGDIVTAIDGMPVKTSSELVRAVKQYRAGESAELTVFRDQDYVLITVVFDEELPAPRSAAEEAIPDASEDLIVREG